MYLSLMGRRFSDAAESHVKVSVSSNLKLSPSLWLSLEPEAPRGCLDWTFAISSSSVTLFLLRFECCSSEIRVVTSVPLWLIMKWVLLCPQGWIKMEVFSLELFHHGKAQQPDPLEDTETRLREMTFPRHLVPWFGAKQRTKSMLFVSFSICDILLEQQKQLGQFLPYSSVILERQQKRAEAGKLQSDFIPSGWSHSPNACPFMWWRGTHWRPWPV